MDILKQITDQLHENITDATFEGANIVLYTNNAKFFKEGESKIKAIVDQIKKRVELRADEKILQSQEATEAEIKKIVPPDAEITQIIFDVQRSIVVIEAKKPGMVIGKQGSILNEIRNTTMWTPQVQRSSVIKSKITDNIIPSTYPSSNWENKSFLDLKNFHIR